MSTQHYRTYVEQPKLDDNANNNGFAGSRSESAAYIAKSAGNIELPELSIPWWDTDENRLKFAKIPVRLISAKGDANPVIPPPQTATAETSSTTLSPPLNPASTVEADSSTIWRTIALIIGLLWIGTLGLWAYSAYRRPANPTKTHASRPSNPRSDGAALRALEQHISQAASPEAVLTSFTLWANAFLGSDGLTMYQIKQSLASSELNLALRPLEQARYAAEPRLFEGGNALLEAIVVIRKQKQQGAKPSSLTPLYFNG